MLGQRLTSKGAADVAPKRALAPLSPRRNYKNIIGHLCESFHRSACLVIWKRVILLAHTIALLSLAKSMLIRRGVCRCSLCVSVAADPQESVLICYQMVSETQCAIRGRALNTAQEVDVFVARRVSLHVHEARSRTLHAKGARYEDR
jgi:hypothetical protein